MPPVARTCSECPSSLAGKSVLTKTCSNKCRLARSRRQRRANREREEFEEHNGTAASEVAAIVRREAPDVIHRLVGDELKPIVREALTEDVLRAINEMVGLTPAAVAALQEDLGSDDSTVRQRAYSLVIKYTIGHPALVKQEDTASQQLVVNFGLPRPEDQPETIDTEPEDVEIECDICHECKPATDFVAGSTRCQACFEAWSAKIKEQFV